VQFNQLGRLSIRGGQLVKCVTQRYQVYLVVMALGELIRKRKANAISAVSHAGFPPSRIDEYATHGFSRGCEEVATVFPPTIISRADQPQIRFMDQRRGVERMPGLLARHVSGGESTQFLIDQWKQLVGRGGVALLNFGKDLRYVAHESQRTTGRALVPLADAVTNIQDSGGEAARLGDQLVAPKRRSRRFTRKQPMRSNRVGDDEPVPVAQVHKEGVSCVGSGETAVQDQPVPETLH
jgi:hypothetical protein